MADFGLVRSFGIDHGELDGMTPQECFVLGYELAMIDDLLTRPEPISKPVHSANRERIEAQCRKLGRAALFTWPHDDVSESWLQFDVAPMESRPGV
jgi:hypothetical protein